jgi:hypothetical protein
MVKNICVEFICPTGDHQAKRIKSNSVFSNLWNLEFKKKMKRDMKVEGGLFEKTKGPEREWKGITQSSKWQI